MIQVPELIGAASAAVVELGIVASHLLDEAFGILATEEGLDGLAERVIGARALVEDHVDEHGAG